MVRKKAILLAVITLAQMGLLFVADQNFKRGVKEHVSLIRETLPAKGLEPNQVEALADVMDNMVYDISGHIRLITTLLIMFNVAAVSLALSKRE